MSQNIEQPSSNLEREIFLQALEKGTGPERAAFLDGACRGDAQLRAAVDALLANANASLLDQVADEARPTQIVAVTEQPGERIGRYKLLQKIGEGGMGVVYMAEQTEPVTRKVALKIIKLGMDTRNVVARFEAERQALAMMDHPNIARVLDGGATESGRPYFVMELVRGVPITEYCDKNHLPTPQRLDLFTQVCHAIQHAHQKGVIHRDIKPSNILVTLNDGVPLPMVIDFGIAKATSQKLTEKTLFTNYAQMIGTPAYMSPEQAEMSKMDVDTRTDIYSLGVLLYELLTGTTPFPAKELLSMGYGEMQRVIAQQEPLRPSTRLSTMANEERTVVAKNRSIDASALGKVFRGDLDWIVMKCLEKDRARRYDTANGLAADLKRHLNNEPVIARPPSAAYRFQKLVRRNRGAAMAAAAILAMLITALTFISMALVRERRARLAAAQAEQAQARLRESAEQARMQAERDRVQADQARAEEAAAHQRTDEALARETKLRQEDEARVYGTDIFLAQQALSKDNFARARELLDRHYPKPGQTNRPGWEWRYLWQQARGDYLYSVSQKAGPIITLSASHDGRSLALGGSVGSGVSVLDISNPRAPQDGMEIPSSQAVAFAPQSALLAYFITPVPTNSAKRSSTIMVRNSDTQQTVATIPDIPGAGVKLVFSSDGGNLFAYRIGVGMAHLDLWRISDTTRVASFTNSAPTYVSSSPFALSPDQSVVAIAGASLKVISLATWKTRWTTNPPRSGYVSVEFSPDGRTLFSSEGTSEPILRRWDVASGQEIGTPIKEHRSAITALMVTPDGKTLVSGSQDQTIRLWDVSDPDQTQPIGRALKGHRAGVLAFVLLPDKKTLFSGSMDGAVLAWDLTRGYEHSKPSFCQQDAVWWAEIRPDGKSLISVNPDGQVVQWSGEEFQFKEPLFSLGKKIQSAKFSDDAGLFAVGSTNGVLELWDVNQRRPVKQFGHYSGSIDPRTFSSDNGKLIVLDRKNRQFCEWDLKTFQERKFPVIESIILDYSHLSPDYRWFVSATFNGDFTVQEMGTNWSLKRNLDFPNVTSRITFSPDGKRFAAGSQLGNAGIWETETLQPVASVGDRETPITSVNFSADGSRLITGSRGANTVTLWDVATQLPLIKLEIKGVQIGGVRFSPDGNRIGCGASGIPANTGVYLWRAPSWEEIEREEAGRRKDDAR